MPAPAPTELLAEDIRDLRESLRQIASDTKGVSTAVAVLQTEMKFFRSVGKFIAGALVTLVISTIGSTIAFAWYASGIVSEVRQQGSRLEKIEQRLDDVIASKSKP